jgi:hypothetical protein
MLLIKCHEPKSRPRRQRKDSLYYDYSKLKKEEEEETTSSVALISLTPSLE